MDQDFVEHYRREGYAVVRGVFGAEDVAALRGAFDRIHARALAYGRSFRHQNVFYRLAQWCAYFDETLARYRTDERMRRIVEPLIGGDVKQIINQLHWKTPGAAHVEFGYYQDVRFRRPRSAYRALATAYVQTGIAVDAHRAENGAMTLVPGSHRRGELDFGAGGQVLDQAKSAADLARAGLDASRLVDLVLEPGDVALWNVFLVHGSGPNRTDRERRFYLNGYVRAADCDRGEWAFRGGRACALGAPVLVHYEELHERPEPHYVDG
ncbi:MAG: phytanoyl-CoA dioxygenase family protein [Alphaproteobacteria bacterium]|nr:phytanoyl-CoA dioxygenase family protein [Alphaproteobacteria bacterium]